jgi:hypothetical protein
MRLEHAQLEKEAHTLRSLRDTKNKLDAQEKELASSIRQVLDDMEGDSWEVGDLIISFTSSSRMDTKVFIMELLKKVHGDLIEEAKEAATKSSPRSRLNVKYAAKEVNYASL